MYLRILKKDLKRKQTMNVILLVFIILATTFIAGSVNNIIAITTAMDYYFDKAGVADYWICISDELQEQKFEQFISENGYRIKSEPIMFTDNNAMEVNGENSSYSQTFTLSDIERSIIKIFDSDNNLIKSVKDGEIYLTADFMRSQGIKNGDKIELSSDGSVFVFTVAGSTKDALFGSPMIGQSRGVISKNDFEALMRRGARISYMMYGVYTDNDDAFFEKYLEAEIAAVFNEDKDTIKLMYIMDMVIAVVLLTVSICLILISLVILRFTIVFTMNEEFREIGVMKAIGIKSRKVRCLYIVKYLAIALAGGFTGFLLSIPFGNWMLAEVSENIVTGGSGNVAVNLFCAVLIVEMVLFFCYLCTRKVNRLTPVDAIRNGANGERFKARGIIRAGTSHMPPVLFLAINDILSGIKKFSSLILTFTIGILLIIIPVNTINTLTSDELLTWFSMAPCDICIVNENVLNTLEDRKTIVNAVAEYRHKLEGHGITADVFIENVFKTNVSFGNRKCSSLAFQGNGDVEAKDYAYIRGTAPRLSNEVAITHIIADKLKADIGDEIMVKIGETGKRYVVTAIFQTMNNMGEGVRFYQGEELDYSYVFGSFAVQVRYKDNPDAKAIRERKQLIGELYPDNEVLTAGEYINQMTGDVSGKLAGVKHLILAIVIFINILVTVLMVRTFMTKERGEIGMLKAVGFSDNSLIAWQTIRIGIVLAAAIILGTLLSTPISALSSGQVFKIMGAETIEFKIVPLEVYAGYPLLILAAAVTAGFLTAQGVRRISAAETANIE